MASVTEFRTLRSGSSRGPPLPLRQRHARVVLSFDVEEHYRIEAAAGLDVARVSDKVYLPRADGDGDALAAGGTRGTEHPRDVLRRRRARRAEQGPGAGHRPTPGTRSPATAGTTAA